MNDSIFACALAAPIIRAHRRSVAGVILSRATTGSPSKLLRVARRASWRYLAYRTLVQCGRRRVATLARQAGIPTRVSHSINREHEMLRSFQADIAVAINLDQILRPDTLDLFPYGVLNAHASRLPADRGVAPALWAFARGDREIWVTLYRMDAGLDTGPVYEQFAVPVVAGESGVTMYHRVCALAGERMAQLLPELDRVEPTPQARASSSPPHTVPDRTFDELLRRSGRRLIFARGRLAD